MVPSISAKRTARESCSLFATSVTSSTSIEYNGALSGIWPTILSRRCPPMILISSFCIVADVYFVRSVASFKWTARTSSSASARNLRRAKKLPGLFPSSDSDSLCPGRAIFCFPQNTIQEIMLRSSFLFFAICLAVSLSMIEVIDVPASRRSEENHRLLVMQLYGIPFFGGP